ncbi:hypothetical protein JW964_12655 [candidate division KSB1 bacterium]|nr:hypothetical protein [candidate division KSB1 bacterium]
MDENQRRKAQKSFKELERAYKELMTYQARMERFTDELMIRLGTIAGDYFTRKIPESDFLYQLELDAEEISTKITADFYLQRYGIRIFDQLCKDVDDFQHDEIPSGRELKYEKVEFPLFTVAAIEERIKKYGKRHGIPNPEKEEILREVFFEQAVVSEYYVNFDILIYQELKKITVNYFPELMEISSTGLREIDYMLYDSAVRMGEMIVKLLET